jgi:hypothetical protein
VSGLPGELWSFIPGEPGCDPAFHSELERRNCLMFLLLLDFRLSFVGRFKTLVIWLKRP